MAHREFRGADGREWAVWSVQPEHAERRKAESPPADDRAVERRVHDEYRVPLAKRYLHGWLCFETKGEKRRLAPVPAAWAEMPDRELTELCDRATRVEHTTRRLVE